jgi:small subunit ribosomal protein S4e
MILKDKEVNVKVDGVARRDKGFPLGVMDILSIEKTNKTYRVLYDTKGRFILKELKKDDEKNIKLLRVTQKALGPNKIPYIVTHDARTIRFPNPEI